MSYTFEVKTIKENLEVEILDMKGNSWRITSKEKNLTRTASICIQQTPAAILPNLTNLCILRFIDANKNSDLTCRKQNSASRFDLSLLRFLAQCVLSLFFLQ